MPRHDREARRESIREWAGEVMGRDDLRDRFQEFAQTYFDRNGQGVDGPALSGPRLPPPPPQMDYTPFYIAAAATLVAAFIVTRKK